MMLAAAIERFKGGTRLAIELARDRAANPHPRLRVAINRRPVGSPWGGGNQWLAQLIQALRAAGMSVRFDVKGRVDVIVLADPRPGGTTTFGLAEIESYRLRSPGVRCLHRINENDLRKGTDSMDRLLAEANRLADHTVFISAWLRDDHARRWFDPARPHTVILNGADPAIFHPVGARPWEPARPMRLVTHHWSDHWNKGFDVYQRIDALIADGRLPETELWVIGRWPSGLRWRAAKTIGPLRGERLAGALRQCHVYVTGSRWEPGGMHVIEAAQCGLPVLYHEDGGGIVEAVQAFGIGFRDDVRGAIDQARRRYPELRALVEANAPSGQRMCAAYLQVIEGLCQPVERALAEHRAGSVTDMR